jgi:hypothetical protein
MALRWLGYDATMSYGGVNRLANWASHETATAARPFNVERPDVMTVQLTGVIPRQRTFAALPAMADKQFTWQVAVMVTPNATVTYLNGRRMPVVGSFFPPTAMSAQMFLPAQEAVAYAPIVLKVRERAAPDLSGFNILSHHTSHVPADPLRPSRGAGELAEIEDDPGDTAGGNE